MDLLKKSWIEPLVEVAVRQSTEAEEQVSSCKEIGKTVNDGSNFRIPVKRPKCAQLVEWLAKEPVPKAVLSDSFTTIHAIFSERVLQNYEKENDLDIRNNSTGCILRISKFEITLAQLRTTPPEISLYIEEIKIQGCEGARIFGNPTNIVRCKAIVELGNKWSSERRDIDPRALSEPNDSSDDSDSESMVSEPDANNTSDNIKSEPMEEDDTNSTQEGTWHTQAPAHLVAQTPKAQGNEDSAPLLNSKTHRLLNALKSKGTRSQNKPHSPSTQEKPLTLDGNKNLVIQPVSASTTANTKRTSATASYRSTSPSSILSSQHEQPSPCSSGKSERKAHENSPQSHQQTNTQRPLLSYGVEVVLASQRTHSKKPRDPGDLCRLGESGVIEIEQMSNRGFFSGWNRIRRRDVFIPESQLNLIESPDSWIPPNAGMRMPQNHVPIDLIQAWSEQHKTREPLSTITSPIGETALDLELVSSPGSQLPEEELGSEQWPHTPPIPRVPPDSSPPRRLRTPFARPHRSTPDSDPMNLADISADPEATALSSSVTKSKEYPDNESYECSEIELSIPRDLYTSTQEGNILPGSPMTESGEEAANHSSLPTEVTDTMLSRKFQEHHPPSPQCLVTPSPRHQRVNYPESPPPNSTPILVPATLKTTTQKSRGKSPSFSTQSATVESQIHHSIPHNSSSGYDGTTVTSQLPVEGSYEPPSPKAPPSVLQVPGSSLENVVQDMVVLPSIEAPVPPPLLHETTQKRKRLDESPLQPLSPRKFPRMSEASASAASRQSKRTYDQVSFSSKTEEIYYKFQQAYKSYTGSLEAFKRACCRLQSLRDKGLMKKSTMWDDFIAREEAEYQNYIQRCHQRQKEPGTYQNYFNKHAKFPQYKRRNLTVRNLQAVVVEAEGEGDDDSGGEDNIQTDTTPEPSTALSRVIPESPCKPGLRDWESEDSSSEIIKMDTVASYMHNRASVELGDEECFRLDANKPRRRKATPFEEEDDDGEEDIFHAVRGRLNQSTSAHLNNGHDIEPSIELDAVFISTNQPHLEAPRNPTPPRREPVSSLNNMQDSSPPTKSKPSVPRKPPAPSLPSHRKVYSASKDKKDCTPATSTWWKDPDTSLKKFSRDYARIPSEFGFITSSSDAPELLVDEAGVLLIHPRKQLQKGGRMDSMGFKFQ